MIKNHKFSTDLALEVWNKREKHLYWPVYVSKLSKRETEIFILSRKSKVFTTLHYQLLLQSVKCTSQVFQETGTKKVVELVISLIFGES